MYFGGAKLSKNRKENKQINFRVTDEEYKRLEEIANNVGLSVPMFCKLKAQGSKIKSPLINREGAIQIASELRKIGVNVNQIAKFYNNGGNCDYKSDIDPLVKELNNLWQLLNSALQGAQID